MKSIYGYILAALVCGTASVQAQISAFSVSSISYTGNDVQIPGLYVSQTALLNISSSPNAYYSNLTEYFAPYYTLSQGVGGTVVANTSGSPEYRTTTITNQYAPNQGFTSTSPITHCSGRFYIEAPQWVWDDEWNQEGHYEGGTSATIQFTVEVSHSFTLNVAAASLSAYGLTGLEAPIGYVYKVGVGYVTSFGGEGNTSLGTLTPGTYVVVTYAAEGSQPDSPTGSGIAVVSVNSD